MDEEIPDLPDFEIARKIGLKRLAFNISVLASGVLSAVLVGSLIGLLIYTNLPEEIDDSYSVTSTPVETSVSPEKKNYASSIMTSTIPLSVQRQGYYFLDKASGKAPKKYKQGVGAIYQWVPPGKEGEILFAALERELKSNQNTLSMKKTGLWEWSYSVAIPQPEGFPFPLDKGIELSKQTIKQIGYPGEFSWEGEITDNLTIVKGSIIVGNDKFYPPWIFKYNANGELVAASGFFARPMKVDSADFLGLSDSIKRSNSVEFLGFTLADPSSNAFFLLPEPPRNTTDTSELGNIEEGVSLMVDEIAIQDASLVYVPFYDTDIGWLALPAWQAKDGTQSWFLISLGQGNISFNTKN